MTEEKKILQRRGSFTCSDRRAEMCGALFAAGLFMTLIVLVLSFFNLGEFWDMAVSTMFIVCVVMLVGIVLARVGFGSGQGCEFEARETEFEVRGPKSRREIFYYKDVVAVNYAQIRRHDRLRGYEVTIVTSIRQVKYRFMFSPNAEFLDTDSTPFYYLEVNSGLREETKLTVNQNAVMAQFENMQRSQKKHKVSRSERVAEFLEGIDKSSKE